MELKLFSRALCGIKVPEDSVSEHILVEFIALPCPASLIPFFLTAFFQ